MESLTLEQIILAVDGECLNSQMPQNIKISSVSIDSRNIEKASLYIPIKGERFDGHSFIEDALDKGAIVALTQNRTVATRQGLLIYVKDTKKALRDLATYYRNQFEIPVIAITGSVGKTSTKDLVSAVLSAKYKVHKTQGNFNNEIGLPLTIFGLTKEHELLVVEMGMNHFGEISSLSYMAKPDIAIITNIGFSHIENLGDRQGILKAKCEIIDGMAKEGVLIINGQDDMLRTIKAPQTLISYGKGQGCLYYAQNIRSLGTGGVSASYKTPEGEMELTLAALGDHMVDNALAAIAVAQQLNLSVKEIKKGFDLYKPTKMRMDLQLEKNGVYIINDTYNASPDSVKAALGVLSTIGHGKRRIAILGDMLEMGAYGVSLHKKVGQYVADQGNIDLLITVGDLSNYIQAGAIEGGFSQDKTLHFPRQESLNLKLKDLLNPQDLILVKASRGMKLENTVDEIGKVKFNES